MRVLVLGAAGMVGHVVTAFLEEQGSFTVVPVVHRRPFFRDAVSMDLREFALLSHFLNEHQFDAIINCAGILPRRAEEDVCSAILINSYLPHYLEHRFRDTLTRVIHISTDCVFSGQKGDYVESDFADGDSVYARTKKMGELNNRKDLTLRLSVVGPELVAWPLGEGLFSWFMAQKREIRGFTHVFWTGLTTVELARQIAGILKEHPTLSGVYHLVPETKIPKHDLLALFNRFFREGKIPIRPDGAYRSDKSLRDTRKEISLSSVTYERMVEEMRSWVDAHREWYPHYG